MREFKDFIIKDNGGYNDVELFKKVWQSYSTILEGLRPEYDWVYSEEGSYQGEWFALGKYRYKGNQPMFVYHQGSFGSCSGCDTLLGISSEDEMEDFLKSMDKVTPCGETFEEALTYLIKEKNNLVWADEALDNVITEAKKKWGVQE